MGFSPNALVFTAFLLTISPEISLSHPASGAFLAVAGFTEGHTLLEFSGSGEVLRQMDLVDPGALLGSPSGLTNLNGSLWIGGANSIHRLDPATGQLTAGFIAVDGPTLTALCSDGTNLLVGEFTSNVIQKFNTSGVLVGQITLDTNLFLTGADSDGTLLYIPSHMTGDVHVFDMSGTTVGVIQTNLPSDITAIALDADGQTFWIATGSGVNDIHHFDLSGLLLGTFPGISPGIMGLSALSGSLFNNGFETTILRRHSVPMN